MGMMIKTKTCKHGTLSWFDDDQYIGKSLDLYGDYSEDEVSVFQMCCRPDYSIAIEVGSNIGSLTVPLAKCAKEVYAFEPIAETYALLKKNIAQNDLTNVHAFRLAVGNESKTVDVPTLDQITHRNYGGIEIGQGDDEVEQITLDSMLLPKINFIKIDAEGSELAVLQGAEKLIERDRPILYIENDRKEKSDALCGWLIDHDYRMYWHQPPLFYSGNFRGEQKNVFGRIISQMMVCAHEDSGVKVDELSEIHDPRVHPKMYEWSLARAQRRLAKMPDDLAMRSVVAHFTACNGDYAAAVDMLNENLRRDPHHLTSKSIKGFHDLILGNYREGWQGYELRYHQAGKLNFGWRPHDVPQWDGRPTDKTVLVWCEQGFGDSLMFARFLKQARERANVILEIQPQLYELFEYSQLVEPGHIFRVGRQLPHYDYHCSLPSLPAVLGLTTEDDVRSEPYLFAEPGVLKSWVKRNDFPKVGICLRGGAASDRPYRDVPVEDPHITAFAQKWGPFMALTHEGQFESYTDTAGAISSLQLVITTDTSIAHLAGALGAPTWLLLSADPDWRWMLHRSDSPFYPSVRIFRQTKFMDWSHPIAEMDALMSEWHELKMIAAE